MAESLRDEVDLLAADWADRAERDERIGNVALVRTGMAAAQLRAILSRHPAADGVVVPRDLFEAMRDDQTKYLGLKRLRGLSDGNDALMQRIDQADAILSTDSGIGRAEGRS